MEGWGVSAMKRLRFILLVISGLGLAGGAIAFALLGGSHARAGGQEGTLCERTYRRLDEVRSVRKEQLLEYLQRLETSAEAIRDDQVMRDAFGVLKEYHRLSRQEAPPQTAVAAIDRLAGKVRRYWLEHYGAFYGILMVDPEGTVFHTVGRGGYEGRNFFEGELRETSIAAHLRQRPSEAFVDYEYSTISREPSAFFVEPVMLDGEFAGWFILQCSVNKINDILARHANLGRTGEVILVNEDCRMLTDSRFRRDSSILKQELSPANIRAKFAEGSGHKIVTDYRGYRAITSFEVCTIKDVRWLLIAKIDEAEVVTEYYREHRGELRSLLVERLEGIESPPGEHEEIPDTALVVDMDEFRRARQGEQVATYGVSTCTAAVIFLRGQFAYMGHASSYDAMYGRSGVDILGHMIEQVKTYEICPFEMRSLQVVLVAPHRESIARAIDRLVDAGLFLSQIRFVHNATARRGSVLHEVDTGRTSIHWTSSDSCCDLCQDAEAVTDVGAVAKDLVAF